MPKWVVVDDTDPGITYTGPWFPNQGTLNNLGSYGPPHLNTLHGTNSNASFSYSFNGTIVRLTGTNQWNNPTGVINPSWQCVVDGVNVPSTTLNPTTPENRLLYCEQDGLSDGLHEITVNVIVSNQTFWFDYIQYLPTPSLSLDQLSLFIEPGDPGFQYGTGWSPVFPGNMTSQTGSTFSFEFTGVFLTWLGFYDNRLPTAPTTATYAIDGQSPITFNLDGGSSIGTSVQYNQVFFHTDQLSPGSHKLDVVYQGNNNTAPLTLYELFLQHNTSSTTTSTGTPTASSSSTSNATSKTKNDSSNLGPIVGGVIGGFVLIIILAALAVFFFLRRRKNNRPREITIDAEPFNNPSMAVFSPLIQHPSLDNFHSPSQHTRDLSGYESTNNTNAASSLSLTPLALRCRNDVDDVTPLSTLGKGQISRNPRLQSKTEIQAAHSSSSPSITGNNSQPTRLVHDEDAGIQLARTDQHGEVVELLPPAYSF